MTTLPAQAQTNVYSSPAGVRRMECRHGVRAPRGNDRKGNNVTIMSTIASLVPDKVFVAAIARAHRKFEPELDLIVASVPTRGTAVDVGVWYGPWTYWLSRRCEQVVDFEPNPDLAAVLDRTVRRNVRVEHLAASDAAGTATLTLPAGGRGTEGRASLEGLQDGGRTVEVKTVRLDDMGLTDVVLLKIDVEGHEFATITGAEQLLAEQHPVLVVELEDRHGGIAPSVDLLASWGYAGKVLVEKRWVPLTEFDLPRHQAEYHAQPRRTGGYLSMSVRKQEPYINNVVFTHPECTWDVS